MNNVIPIDSHKWVKEYNSDIMKVWECRRCGAQYGATFTNDPPDPEVKILIEDEGNQLSCLEYKRWQEGK